MYQRSKIAVAVALALPLMSAIAQENVARVEVTGSRIRQVDLETAQPIQVMTQEQIQKTGLVTVGDILNNLTSAGAPSFSKGGALTSNKERGGQYVNLRLLGAQRLLVLVNGKRWPQTVAGFTDLSTIPSALIERMEVLKDGASSIYGSDAIAGVVNIILKKSMNGGQLNVYSGQNELGDGKSRDFSLTYGAGDEKASLVFGLAHTEQGAVWAKDRELTAYSRGPQYPLEGLGGGAWGRIRQVGPTGNPTGFDKIIDHTGDQYGGGTSADARNPANYHNVIGGAPVPADLFSTNRQMMLATPTRTDNVFVKGELELPYDMRLRTTAMYSQRKSDSTTAGYPLTSDTQSTYRVYIDKDSYYNPYGNQVAGAGKGEDLWFSRRTTEVTRDSTNTNRTFHVDATLEGHFQLRGLPWNWSAGWNHARIDGAVNGTGNLNLLNLKKALGPSFLNSEGVVQCGTPASPIALTECKPWNILGGPSASTPEVLRYVMATSQATFGSKTDSATIDLAGEVFTLPAGNVGIAAGLERRQVSGHDSPGQFSQSGYSTDLAGNSTGGRYTVKEAYAELQVPLLSKMALVESLSMNVAARHSDYSNYGVSNNSKVSLQYRPTKDVLVRGTWAEGFRAPTLNDTFGGGAQSYDSNWLDPCDSVHGDAARSDTTRQRCEAGYGGIIGVKPGYRQLLQSGAALGSSGGAQTKYPFTAGAGNAMLRPETAVTRTLGLVFSPASMPGFSAAIDWYNVKIANRITTVTASWIANQCYIQGEVQYCANIVRDAENGNVVGLTRGNVNMGAVETEGVDLDLRYRLPRTALGQFSVRSETSYLDSYRTRTTATSKWQEQAGEYDFHRVKSTLTLDWSNGNWGASWTTRYASAVLDACLSYAKGWECNRPEHTRSGANSAGANRLASLVYHDMNVSYKTSWNGRVMVGVNNLFDKKPRFTLDGASSATSVDADLPIDRFFYVRYTQQF